MYAIPINVYIFNAHRSYCPLKFEQNSTVSIYEIILN